MEQGYGIIYIEKPLMQGKSRLFFTKKKRFSFEKLSV